MEPKRFALPNGLRLAVVPRSEARGLAAVLAVATGSVDDPPERAGEAHLLEHVLLCRTGNFPGDGELERWAASWGGTINATTGQTVTSFSCQTRRESWREAIAVLAEIVQRAAFQRADVQREVAVVLDERQTAASESPHRVVDFIWKLFWPDHPYARQIIGSPGTIHRIRHHHLLERLRQSYAPDNTALAVVGDVEPNDVYVAVRREFEHWRGNAVLRRPIPRRFHRDLQIVHDAGESEVVVAVPTNGVGDVRQGTIAVLAHMLSVNRGCGVYQAVMNGYAEDAVAASVDLPDAGAFYLGARGVPRLARAMLLQLLDIFRTLPDRLSQRDLDHTRLLFEVMLGRETHADLAESLAQAVVEGNPFGTMIDLARYARRLSLAEVREVARDLSDRANAAVLVIGPHRRRRTFQQILTLARTA